MRIRCELLNQKHMMRIVYVEDNFLVGEVRYRCEKCHYFFSMDRFWWYMSMRPVIGRRGT